jgi:hypothetical protein
MASRELQEPAGMCTGSADVSTESGVGIGEFVIAKAKEAGKAEENDMNRVELQRILGYSRFSSAVFVNTPINETA